MSFIRSKPRKLASGEIKNYYYEVENFWKDGKVKQKIIKYLGTSPFQTEFDLDPKTGVQVARVLSRRDVSSDVLKKQLEKLGISFPPGKFKEARLIFKPPLQRLVVRISCV
jgi:hypothetical protein